MPRWFPLTEDSRQRRWFWATLTLSSISIVALVFAAWEVVENRLFSHVDYITLHYLYITRGITSSLLLAFWAAWYVLRERRHSEEQLRRSHERYRGLLEASPGAVVLYDSEIREVEWNATAERLYGWRKEEILGHVSPTIPEEKEAELRVFLQHVGSGSAVLNVETLRRDRGGNSIDVQLSLIPFQDAPGQLFFLEVTEDIRERVRMRANMLQIEKLATMGKMAAGVAHHLNTPLAAMLLRVQMMLDDIGPGRDKDLERLEAGIRSCQQFVRRLLDFSRRPPANRQPEELAHTIRSVISFLAPAVQSKGAIVSVDLAAIEGELVLADRNLLEALFSTLLSNSLDAVLGQGSIEISGGKPRHNILEVRIRDNGCGIDSADQPHVFEPFFTTKEFGKGTGLGLAIARNIVDEHGGSIRLESRLGEGTVAFIELPVYEKSPVSHRISA